mmetsp:Transcript_32644/g.64723  ORF Transcript_32644/g.64723 Transcript_32644/m.64723 type:complete len:80 (-) Transcript_32644:1317-1556(-)
MDRSITPKIHTHKKRLRKEKTKHKRNQKGEMGDEGRPFCLTYSECCPTQVAASASFRTPVSESIINLYSLYSSPSISLK